MAKNKWLWIGCGGCLSFILVIILLLAAGMYSCQRYAKNVQMKIEQWDRTVRSLNETYPFTEPEDHLYNAERYAAFLKVREKTLAVTKDKLGWLLAFAESPHDRGGMTIIQLVKNFIMLPNTLYDIGIAMTEALSDAGMSLNEYRYVTKITAGEIVSWKTLEPGGELNQLSTHYIKPLEDINEKIEEARKKNPHSNIDPGPFDLNKFLDKLPDHKDIPEETSKMIQTHKDQLVASESACLVDAIAVGF